MVLFLSAKIAAVVVRWSILAIVILGGLHYAGFDVAGLLAETFGLRIDYWISLLSLI